MRNIALLLILFLGFYLFSCSSSKPTTQLVKDGTYNFVFFDTSVNKKCDGKMTVEYGKTDQIFGKYVITKRYVDTIKGLQSDKGYYEGKVDKNTNSLFINMNPKIADANIFVNVNLIGDSLIGTWNYSTMMGIQDKGVFKAGLIE